MSSVEELENVACPLCGSKNYADTYVSKDFLFSKEAFTVVRCTSCGVHFTNPRVREDKIGSYYYPEYLSGNDLKQAGLFQKAKDRLGRVLGNIHWDILKLLQSINARTVLEIGPGNGSLLYFLKQHGLEIEGVETDHRCVQRLRKRGISCHCGDLNEVISKVGAKKFDAVILCHAFEHLYNPRQTLGKIFDLLNEKGMVYLNVPNIGSTEAKLFGKYWRGLDLPRHIIHYDPGTLKMILNRNGFDVIKIKNQTYPASLVESLGFLFFKKRKMPNKAYLFFYYLWKLLAPIHLSIFGSGVMEVIATKKKASG